MQLWSIMAIEKLVNVEVGDLILLKGTGDAKKLYPGYHESAGFVAGIKYGKEKDYVKLSHDNPLTAEDASAASRRIGRENFAGNRWYDLQAFDDYEILKKAKDNIILLPLLVS